MSPSPAPPGFVRPALHVLLAALPLLAISAHVFGLVEMQISAAVAVIPLATVVLVLSVFAPHAADRVVLHGLVWGVLACGIYDVFRLDTVYMLGLWGDFIPTMGTWITGNPDGMVGGAVVGYLWRYIGDGGGIGITFFVVAAVCGLQRCSRRTVVLAAVGFGVFPVWSGLIATVGLAPQGQQLMFTLTPTTVLLSLIGHLIFGLVLGLGFWRSRAVLSSWPWAPLLGLRAAEPSPGVAAPRSSEDAEPAPLFAPGPHSAVVEDAFVPEPRVSGTGGMAARRPHPGRVRERAVRVRQRGAEARERRDAQEFATVQALVPRKGTPADDAPGIPRQRASASPEDDGPVRTPATSGSPAMSGTSPAERTLDPDTWAEFRRRLESTEPGRRAHGGRRYAGSEQRDPV
ncbi:hypothetical protein WIS52_05640 [Pseudonocardia nematodicida]|uniref:Uncharacterized protein n=1 Tax=Pseudonocardia nematodicida TaxID=1206997 RepID=A0ABV1K648_9PSEU